MTHVADILGSLIIERKLVNSRIENTGEQLRKDHRDRVGKSYYAYPDPITGKMTAYALPTWEAISAIADDDEAKVQVIDTETTGLNVFQGARPIAIAAVGRNTSFYVEGKPQQGWREERPYGTPHKISAQASAVNGVTQEAIEALTPWLDCDAYDLNERLRDAEYIVGHNAWFDIGMIAAMLHDTIGVVLDIDPAKVIDTQVIAGMLFPGEKTSLNACLARYGLTRTSDRHNALEDAQLTKSLLSCLWHTKVLRDMDADVDEANKAVTIPVQVLD